MGSAPELGHNEEVFHSDGAPAFGELTLRWGERSLVWSALTDTRFGDAERRHLIRDGHGEKAAGPETMCGKSIQTVAKLL